MRDILRIFFALLALFFYCIVFWGYIRLSKVSKELKKQDDTEIVSKETLDAIKVANRLILIGIISGTVFGLIAVLILHGII